MALLPTYTPIRTDEISVSGKRVFYGAVGVYLEQKSAFFRKRHAAIDWFLNRPSLLNLAAKLGGSTDARELGELALGVLRGENGTAQKELDELVAWLRDEFKPDLVHITNSMFLGLVRTFKQELRVPVVVAVQGEDLFIDELPPAYRDQVVAEMRARAGDADIFLAPNDAYADTMAELLGVGRDRFAVIPLGIQLDGHSRPLAPRPSSEAPAIGYLARICPEKGLHLLVDAFVELAQEPEREDLRLRVAGYLGAKDRPYYLDLENKITAAGLIRRYDFLGEVDRPSKIAFLRSLDLFSVPTVYREAKGISILEAMANAVPVVQPEHGAFPEMIRATGGGILVEPHSAQALAAGLRKLLDAPGARARLGAAGRTAVLERFSDGPMAEATASLYQSLVAAALHPAEQIT
ncbi:MAG: glycosyltransferase family 4 protein [Acidobacteria bacterium]|nr:glycosyltransferase family 4 protein [Acidobacteriota bacterium]